VPLPPSVTETFAPARGGFVLGLLQARLAKGMTQDEVAARAGIARETAIRLEHGQRRALGPTVNAMAYALDVPVSVLRVSATRSSD
jgi:transcriptional regulator with XRE-family HTH domain